MGTTFNLDKRADKLGDYPIRVSITLNGQRTQSTVGFNISDAKWDATKQRVKNGCSNAKKVTASTINEKLRDIESYFEKLETRLQQKDIDSVDLRAEYGQHFGTLKDTTFVAPKEKSIFDYLDEFQKEMGRQNNWTDAVYQKFSTLNVHLSKFRKNLTFDYLDKDGLNKFVDYLHTVTVAGKLYDDRDTRVLGMRNSTIKKQLGFLKWFLRWATAKGYNTQIAFQLFKPKLTVSESKVVFLEWEELMTVYNFQFPESKKHLEKVRDVFCFCCFTSLRYSDVANLKRSNITGDCIHFTTIKTADTLTIELNDYSRAILDKYKDESFIKDRALPIISNQRMNEHLKELGEVCGIDTPVTITYYKGKKRFDEVYPKYQLLGTHTGRRTFICNAIMMGIAPQVVMKWTGHSDYKSMKPYIDIADRAKVDAMNLFNMKNKP